MLHNWLYQQMCVYVNPGLIEAGDNFIFFKKLELEQRRIEMANNSNIICPLHPYNILIKYAIVASANNVFKNNNNDCSTQTSSVTLEHLTLGSLTLSSVGFFEHSQAGWC